MEQTRLARQMTFLTEVDRMKSIYRHTLLTDRSRRETDAEHSWHFALMAMLLSEYAGKDVDPNRVIRMALVHDLVELYAGDTFAYDSEGKRRSMSGKRRLPISSFPSSPPIRGRSCGRSGRNLMPRKRPTPVLPARSIGFSLF